MSRVSCFLLLAAALAAPPAAAQEGVQVPEVGQVMPEIRVDGPAVQPEAPAADAVDPDAAGVSVRVRPTHVSRQETVRFGDDGGVQQRGGSLSLQFVAEVSGGPGLLGTALPEVSTLETLAGGSLSIQPDGRRGLQPLQAVGGRGQGAAAATRQLSFAVSVADPPAAQGVRSARGTITFVEPDGPLRELRFVPLERFTGRTALVEDMGDAAFRLEAQGPDAVQLAFPEAFERHLVDVALADPAGGVRVLERGRWNTWRRDGTAYLRLRGEEVPEGGGLVLRLHPTLREVVIPWSCGPFDLPVPGGDAGPHLAMRTTDPADAMPAAGAGGGAEPRVEPLPLRVLGE